MEDEFARMVKADKVRMVEAGGDRLIHVLGHNDPWATETVCGDKTCIPCGSRLWLRETTLEAKRVEPSCPILLFLYVCSCWSIVSFRLSICENLFFSSCSEVILC